MQKLQIMITPKKKTVDAAGRTVREALKQMGHKDVTEVSVGRYLEIELLDGASVENAIAELKRIAARANVFNPIMEDMHIKAGE